MSRARPYGRCAVVRLACLAAIALTPVPAISKTPVLVKPVSVQANDEYPGHPATALIDGNLRTKWAGRSNRNAESIVVFDFGREVELGGIVVYHAEAGGETVNLNTEAFHFEYGPSPQGPWALLFQVRDNMEARTVRRFPATGLRHLRLVITDAMCMNNLSLPNDDDIARLFEIEFYAAGSAVAAASPPGPGSAVAAASPSAPPSAPGAPTMPFSLPAASGDPSRPVASGGVPAAVAQPSGGGVVPPSAPPGLFSAPGRTGEPGANPVGGAGVPSRPAVSPPSSPSNARGIRPVAAIANNGFPGYPATHLIDGDPKTMWAGSPDPNRESIVVFDFGRDVELGGAVVHHAESGGAEPHMNTEAFRFEHGPSPRGSWTALVSTHGNRAARTTHQFPPATRLRYLRLVVTDAMCMNEIGRPNDDDIARIFMVEFFTPGAVAAAPPTAAAAAESPWMTDVALAAQRAVAERKNIVVFFRSEGTRHQAAADPILLDPAVQNALLARNVLLVIDIRTNAEAATRFGVVRAPTLSRWTPDGKELARLTVQEITRQAILARFVE